VSAVRFLLQRLDANRVPVRDVTRSKINRYKDDASLKYRLDIGIDLARRSFEGKRARLAGFLGAGSVGAQSGISGAASRVLTENIVHAA
jgi:hypothetical protein